MATSQFTYRAEMHLFRAHHLEKLRIAMTDTVRPTIADSKRHRDLALALCGNIAPADPLYAWFMRCAQQLRLHMDHYLE